MKRPDFSIEKSYLDKGYRYIAGVDEAGRGALAGPLCVAMVIYDLSNISQLTERLSSIDDSKKLTPGRRANARGLVMDESFLHITKFMPHSYIDSTNINIATESAIIRILEKLKVKPDLILMDGNFKFKLGVESVSVIKGDQKSLSIASASVLAKVDRDFVMERLDEKYQGYGLGRNMGYGTKEHRDSINLQGPSDIHRMSYEPMKSMF